MSEYHIVISDMSLKLERLFDEQLNTKEGPRGQSGLLGIGIRSGLFIWFPLCTCQATELLFQSNLQKLLIQDEIQLAYIQANTVLLHKLLRAPVNLHQ